MCKNRIGLSGDRAMRIPGGIFPMQLHFDRVDVVVTRQESEVLLSATAEAKKRADQNMPAVARNGTLEGSGWQAILIHPETGMFSLRFNYVTWDVDPDEMVEILAVIGKSLRDDEKAN